MRDCKDIRGSDNVFLKAGIVIAVVMLRPTVLDLPMSATMFK